MIGIDNQWPIRRSVGEIAARNPNRMEIAPEEPALIPAERPEQTRGVKRERVLRQCAIVVYGHRVGGHQGKIMGSQMGSDAAVLRGGSELVAETLRQAQRSLLSWSER